MVGRDVVDLGKEGRREIGEREVVCFGLDARNGSLARAGAALRGGGLVAARPVSADQKEH
jgi:hypothetical protein